jgi:hypothetical protein
LLVEPADDSNPVRPPLPGTVVVAKPVNEQTLLDALGAALQRSA